MERDLAVLAGGVGHYAVSELAAFLSTLTLRRDGLPDSGEWRNVGDFNFYSAERGETFTVPDGSPTDLASVPRIPVLYWWAGGRGDEPAVLHDHGYRSGLFGTRAEVDALFAEALRVIDRLRHEARLAKIEASDLPAWRRKLATARAGLSLAHDRAKSHSMYAGVRIGGHWSYKDRAGTLAPLSEPMAP